MTLHVAHGLDKWLAPILLTDADNTFEARVGTSGTWSTVTIPTVEYLPYLGVDALDGRSSFFEAVAQRLNVAIGGGFVVSAQTSKDALDIGASRINVSRVAGGVWQIRGDTMGMALLGAGLFDANDILTSDAQGVMRMPQSYSHCWWSHNPYGGGAEEKEPRDVLDIEVGSKKVFEAEPVVWGRYRLRRFLYTYLADARIVPGRANDPTRAKLAGLDTGDTNATFVPIWRALNAGRDGDDDRAVVVCHDMPAGGLLGFEADRWEAVTLYDEMWPDYSKIWSKMQVTGDFHTGEMLVRVARGTYHL